MITAAPWIVFTAMRFISRSRSAPLPLSPPSDLAVVVKKKD
jgi:hypothetical protein